MKRRKFLNDTIKGMPLLLFTPTFSASFGKDNNDINSNGKSVVVIGYAVPRF